MDDYIIKYIADFLKPWKPQLRQVDTGCLVEKSEAELRTEISNAIRSEIERLRELVPNYFAREAIQKTREDARNILQSIDQLEKQLASKTLSPELQLRLHLDAKGDQAVANAPGPRLRDALKTVRELCQAADDRQPQADQEKFWCATIALSLINDFSKKRPTAGSVKTPYCAIAGLLYQSVTGREESLRGVCQDVLRPYLDLLPS
jgi:hypothetical protein